MADRFPVGLFYFINLNTKFIWPAKLSILLKTLSFVG